MCARRMPCSLDAECCQVRAEAERRDVEAELARLEAARVERKKQDVLLHRG